jgi:hypothetical protein
MISESTNNCEGQVCYGWLLRLNIEILTLIYEASVFCSEIHYDQLLAKRKVFGSEIRDDFELRPNEKKNFQAFLS